MKKITFLFVVMTSTILSFGQTPIYEKYIQATTFLNSNDVKSAYEILKELKLKVNTKDTLFHYVTWAYVMTTIELEGNFRNNADYENSLKFGLEAEEAIKENKKFFGEKLTESEQWMNKNIVVSYFGLGQYDKAKKYKEKLYKGYKNKTLPKGIDGYFNFDFFKLADKNIWGYEWYPELPDDRNSSSFTKIVYYVYNTNQDGTDKDQLFMLHVLMFHQDRKDVQFDYILEKRVETEKGIVSGSYFQYRYKKDIDYKKLKEDIIQIVTEEIEPSTRRTISK